MIDLSFLTEEEQDAIMKVLQRDAVLKRTEEERVRHLPEKIKDDQQLKNMSGQWFYEAKAKRHREKIHGADIIRASMRKKRLPMAAGQSKDKAIRAKQSWVNNVNKDAFLPPELSGVVEEPEDKAAPANPSSSAVNPASSVMNMSQENTRKAPLSPAKQRKNPFNSSKLPEDHLSQQTKNEQSENGSTGLLQISKEDELSESKERSSTQDMSSQNLEKSKQIVPADPANGSQIKAPIPKARKLIYKSNDVKQDDNQSFLRQRIDSLNARGAPRGILKRNSSSSSTDSETLRFNHNFEPKSKTVSPGVTIHERISEKEHSLEDDPSPNSLEPLKHVRFSAVKDELPQSPGRICGREVGEFSVLEPDSLKTGTEDSGNIDELWDDPKPPQYKKPLPFHQSASSPSASKNETYLPVTSGSVPNDGLQSLSEVLNAEPRSTENSPTIICEHQAKSSELTKLESELSPNPADELSHCVEPEPSQVPDCSSRDHQQDDTSLKENGSKALSPTKVKLKPVRSDLTFQVERKKLLFEEFQDNDANIISKYMNLSQEDTSKEGLGVLQPLESYRALSQENKNMDYSQGSKSIGKGNGVPHSTSNYFYNVLEGSDIEVQVPYNTKNIGNFGKDEPKLLDHEKNKGNSEVSFDSTVVQESNLKDNMKAERKGKEENTSILETSLETENSELLPRAADNRSWKKPEVQLHQEAGEVPKNQVEREKYKRVRERISFWEGEREAAAKLTHKEPTSSGSQEQPSAKALQPEMSQGVSMDSLSTGQNEFTQVIAKLVVLDENDQASHLPSFYSSNKPKEIRPQISSGPSKNCSSTDQSDKVPLFHNEINEHIKRWPVEDSLHSKRDITLPVLQHPSNIESEKCTSLKKDKFLIGESSANFKVMSLKERMDEPYTEHVYHYSQFENLKKFWNLGTNSNSKDNYEVDTTSPKTPVAFNSPKHKKLSDTKSSGKNTHKTEALLSQRNMAGEEMEKLNTKGIFQVLPDDTTFTLESSRKFTHQLAGNDSSKKNWEKNMEWFVTPVLKEEKHCSDEEIQESIVKTSIVSKDYKDTFNDSLQKLLSEASLLVIQPSGGKVCGKQLLEPGVSEDRKWVQKTDFSDNVQEAKGPTEIPNEHADKAIVPSLDKLLKEATGTSHSSLQTKMEPVTTTTNLQPNEKEIKENHNTLFYQREITLPFPEGDKTSGNVALTQKAESDEYQLNKENLFQMTAEGSSALAQPSHLHGRGSFEDVANFPQDMTFSRDAHLAHQDKALSSQREISETMKRVILPPKLSLNDVNDTLQRLLREVSLSYPSGREIGPGDMKADFSEGVQTASNPPNPLEVIPPGTAVDTIVPDRKDFHTFTVLPDEAHEDGSHLAPQMFPSEQLINSSVSIVAQCGKEQPQEVAEIVRETIIQPKSEYLKFSIHLENLLEETLQTTPSKYGKDTGTLSLSEFIGSTEEPKQAASEFHPEEIQETIEKAEALLITESAFDTGFEKLLKEISEVPLYQFQVSMKEETPEKESSGSEQASFSDTMPHFYWATLGSLETKDKSGLKSQVNQCDKVLGGDEAVTDLLVDLCGSTSSRVEISGTPQLYVDHEIETRDSERDITEGQGDFQKPDFEEAPEAIDVFKNKQPILLTNKKNPTKISKVELMLASSYKRQDKEQEKEGFSDSDFSDGNTSSNAESSRNTSSSEEEPNPVLKTLERSAARKMPSKSLEDVSSDPSNQAKVDNLPEELVHSAEDDPTTSVSTVPSQPDDQFSHPDKLKRMSKSVPAFLQDESDDRETDTASESSYQLSRHKKSPSSLTNLSSSSGMTSLSSVSGSVMSVYSGDFGNLEVKGNIQFAVDYVESLKELHVFVAQCKDLAAADIKRQRSDPYVKTYLLPDKGKMGKKKTLVAKKTLNPVFNEILRYKIEKQILKTQKLNLSVWHRDTFKRNSFLGEVELDLETWDWDNKQNKQLKWYPLKQKTAPVALEAENRGEMKLALQYVPEPIPGKKLPTTGEVHIWVKECFDLPLLRGSHLNSFVKCTILPDTSRKSRQKTRAVGKTNNPVFNHTMVYDGFRPEDLMEACVELTVWDHYKLTNQFLGGLRIGFGTGKSYGTEVDWMDSTLEEVALWEKMVNSPNTWIEATLPLRMLLIAKISK
ncbi:synaptotagmin-like protein 2 isoform X2 [Heterocephalus glaber]|uniref:Synaptotagmin-like protein 2 n=1 Tax=Heterocephalus glaber TaxID=10181 RepID=A0AAX6S417_HETGA|nr:synaptotagmin-like protein 2 isoform X2 [Heterocephalus glaber]